MRFKKIVGLITTIAISLSSIPAFAAFTDVPSQASYKGALEQVSSLGIIKGTGDGSFNPDANVTREQFATMIVKAAGLEDKAQTLKGSSIFLDVDSNGWSSGYINAAVDKGYISGMPDNRFYPESSISFAQACTVLVKALGYGDSDLQGSWPKNYIEKAKTLGLVTGINIGTNSNLPRWAAAVMINNLLDIDVKSTSTAKTFAESTGVYIDSFIFADYKSNSKLLENQIQTDKGIYYFPDGMQLEVGAKYRFVVDEDKIIYAYNTNASVVKISVDSIIDNKVSYKENGSAKTMILPDKTTYYYQGNKLTYDTLKSSIQSKSSIVLIYNKEKTGFEYGLVFDPVVSKPFILQGVGADAKIPSEFDTIGTTIIAKGLDDGETIDGKLVTLNDLKLYDALYNVSDIWGQNRHILMVRNKVNGTVKSILPDKISPKKVNVDGKEYELSSNFNASKINTTSGSFKIDDVVTLVLGNDGKVIDMYYRDFADNSNFAIVLDTSYYLSESPESRGKILYKVSLLHTDGTTGVYNTDTNLVDYKGKLVKFQRLGENRVSIDEKDVIEYLDTSLLHEHKFAIDERTLDGDYIGENAVIFNIKSNVSGSAVSAEVLDLSQIPRGTYQAKKILYINKAGMFSDINLLVTNDILDNQIKQGLVTATSGSGQNKTYTMLIDGTSYTFTGVNIPIVTAGYVLQVKMENNKVGSIVTTLSANDKAQTVQAIDSKRIKIHDRVYWFSNSSSIYLKDSSGNMKLILTDDVDLSTSYVNIDLYFDKDYPYGGKIQTVVITE